VCDYLSTKVPTYSHVPVLGRRPFNTHHHVRRRRRSEVRCLCKRALFLIEKKFTRSAANTSSRLLGLTVYSSVVVYRGLLTTLPQPASLTPTKLDTGKGESSKNTSLFSYSTVQASKITPTTSNALLPRAMISHHASSSSVPTTRFAPVSRFSGPFS
jgi:hypothetical protein